MLCASDSRVRDSSFYYSSWQTDGWMDGRGLVIYARILLNYKILNEEITHLSIIQFYIHLKLHHILDHLLANDLRVQGLRGYQHLQSLVEPAEGVRGPPLLDQVYSALLCPNKECY